MKTLKRGAKGTAVRALQSKLSPKHYKGKTDGDFGPMTETGVRDFQVLHFSTGVFDERTSIALDEVLDAANPRLPKVLVPSTRAQMARIFGDIKYVNTAGGQVRITNGWARRNMVKVELPIVGRRWIHRKLVAHFSAALRYIEGEGLANEISQFGTWAPRHILHNPRKPLSLHSWGIAVDINWFENHYGDKSSLHPVIIEGFKKFGFTWGGDWRTKDPMHFQYFG